jgi:hypothetical protein
MIDARQHLPRCGARPPANRLRVGAAFGEWRDGEAVIRGACQPVERRPLEHGINQLAPFFAGRFGEIGGEQ